MDEYLINHLSKNFLRGDFDASGTINARPGEGHGHRVLPMSHINLEDVDNNHGDLEH